MNEWIRNDGPECVLHDTQSGVEVWLYFNDQNEVIGFGSLAREEWPINGPDQPKSPITLLYAWAIQMRFQKEPSGEENREIRYWKQIYNDLLAKARKKTDRVPVMGLYVHPDSPYKDFYRDRLGFIDLPHEKEHNPRFDKAYPAMIRSIEDVQVV